MGMLGASGETESSRVPAEGGWETQLDLSLDAAARRLLIWATALVFRGDLSIVMLRPTRYHMTRRDKGCLKSRTRSGRPHGVRETRI